MAALHFLRQMKYNVAPIFFYHGTKACDEAQAFLEQNSIIAAEGARARLQAGAKPPKGKSKEEFWRDARYQYFKTLPGEVIVAHHLSDVRETWLWGCIHGTPQLIPYRHGNVIRPFLATPKAELLSWAERHNVRWIEDETNSDVNHQRNRIRHNIMPEVLKINPGIDKVLRKKLLQRELCSST